MHPIVTPLPHLKEVPISSYERQSSLFEISFILFTTAFLALGFFKILSLRSRENRRSSYKIRFQKTPKNDHVSPLSSIDEEKGYQMRFFEKDLRLDVTDETLQTQLYRWGTLPSAQSNRVMKTIYGHRFVGDI
jgi:hypothetical protein